MEGANAIHNTKHQKQPSSEKNHEEYPTKFHHHFLYKAAIVAIFLVILPLFPSQAPEFINQTLHTRGWELLHLLLVGIAISYGLFSSRNNETDKEKENNMSKFDNAQILVSRVLQVSSFFEDGEADENSSSDSDHGSTNVQTWNNQHYRNEPVVVVAPHEDQGGGVASASARSRIGEKPLLLPVRSLKSRLSDDDDDDDAKYVNESQRPQLRPQFSDAKVDNDESSTISSFSLNRSNSKTGSKRFSRSSSKGRNDELEGVGDAKVENKMENVVLPSPIPWRSRSGRLEPKQEVEAPKQHVSRPTMEESEFNNMEPRLGKSQTSLSSRTSTLPSSPKFTPPPSFSPESVKGSLAKNSEDLMRKKVFYNKSCPPPPPPPPMFQKSISMKPRYGSFNERASYSSFDKELKRSFSSETNDMKMNRIESSTEVKPKGYAENMSNIGKSVRKNRADQSQDLFGKEGIMGKGELEGEEHFKEEQTRKVMGYDSVEFGEEEEKESFLSKVVMESDDEDTETEDEDVGGRIIKKESVEGSKTDETNCGGIIVGDEGPDVDKKADEFIAKFREQIRLQRIESIKRSATNITRNSSR